jgi:hypothetical protein
LQVVKRLALIGSTILGRRICCEIETQRLDKSDVSQIVKSKQFALIIRYIKQIEKIGCLQ